MTSIARRPSLDAVTQDAVRALAEGIEHQVGAPPLNDQTLSQLGEQRPDLLHLLAFDGDRVVGYAQLAGDEAEVAAPSELAAELLAAAEDAARRQAITVWAHGRHSPVAGAAEARGYRRVRELWQLRRPLTGIPPAPVPDGVAIRAFVPGQDEDAWLAVNAAAFAKHAEQGRWTRADLAAREAESWFDPEGFLLAEGSLRPEQDSGRELLGFHWTKLHPGGMGEVYVLGVEPGAQGMRLGPALLVAGLEYLAGRGAPEVLLYVDGDNLPAVRLYERFGFARHDLDVQLRRAPG